MKYVSYLLISSAFILVAGALLGASTQEGIPTVLPPHAPVVAPAVTPPVKVAPPVVDPPITPDPVAPHRRCASKLPQIVPVIVQRCDGDRICLDTPAQIALAKNLAAYEAWVNRVKECEAR